MKSSKLHKHVYQLAEKAGFVTWGDEDFGPGPGYVDWSSNYDKELIQFYKMVRKEVEAEYAGRTRDNKLG